MVGSKLWSTDIFCVLFLQDYKFIIVEVWIHVLAIYVKFDMAPNSSHGNMFALTHDVLVMLGNDRGPMLPLRSLDVDVDEPIARRIQVGVEREQRSLIGDVGVLGLKVVYNFDPWQQT